MLVSVFHFRGIGMRRLRLQRVLVGISQAELARRAGMALFRYWQIENGEGPELNVDEQAAVAAALGVKVSEIAWPEFAKAQAS